MLPRVVLHDVVTDESFSHYEQAVNGGKSQAQTEPKYGIGSGCFGCRCRYKFVQSRNQHGCMFTKQFNFPQSRFYFNMTYAGFQPVGAAPRGRPWFLAPLLFFTNSLVAVVYGSR
jgi:hypothetical protein